MITGTYNLPNLYVGEPFYETVILYACDGSRMNLSGFSGNAPIRSTLGSTGGYLGQFTVGIVSPVSGVLSLSMTDAETSALTPTQGVYSLTLSLSGVSFGRKLRGYVDIIPNYGGVWP